MSRLIEEHDVLHERASATPETVARRRSGEAIAFTAPEPADPSDASLRGRQRWFARAVMTPESADAPVTAEEAATILTRGPTLGPMEGLEIYRRGYHARLVECLADDYPVLSHALGDDLFHELCHAYIAASPSTSPSLNYYGRRMSELLRSGAGPTLTAREFAADLAELEWAIVEVIHAPSAEPLTPEGLAHVPADAWATARLVPNTALRLLQFDYPVNRYLQELRDGGSPLVPEPGRSATVVYRSGPSLWRMDLVPAAHAALGGLIAGETLEVALGRAESALSGESEEAIAQRVMQWFQEWVSSGLFTGVLTS